MGVIAMRGDDAQEPNYDVWGEPEVEPKETRTYDAAGKLHSAHNPLGDCEPAVTVSVGNEVAQLEWWSHGERHRDGDRPALICGQQSGQVAREWWRHGKRHREGDRPAVISYDGHDDQTTREWWFDGERHRDHQRPAVLVHDNGDYCISDDFGLDCTDHSVAAGLAAEAAAEAALDAFRPPYRVEYWEHDIQRVYALEYNCYLARIGVPVKKYQS